MAQHDKDAPANNAATEQQLATARADGVTEGIQKGRAEGATAERARVKSILTCDAAKDRTKLAQHLAFDTDQSIDAATALLANAGVEATAKPANALDVAMRGTNPAVGTGPDQSGNAPKPPKSSSQVYDMRRKAVGSAQK